MEAQRSCLKNSKIDRKFAENSQYLSRQRKTINIHQLADDIHKVKGGVSHDNR